MADASESTSDRRAKLTALRESIPAAESKNDLISEINKALEVSEPLGSPGTLELLGKRFTKQSEAAEKVRDRVEKVAKSGLPDVWAGSTGAKASEVVGAASRAADEMGRAFHTVGLELMRLSDSLKDAQKRDSDGRAMMRGALKKLGSEDGWFDDIVEKDAEEAERKEAQATAGHGVTLMLQGATIADEAARDAARQMNKYASEARAGTMRTDELSDADKLALADTGAAGGPRELNELLSANDLQRSGQFMEKMNAKDRAEFEKMLADAKSPQERAYLVKALAAGNDMGDLREFQGKIHGKDPKWLTAHLTPVVTAKDSMNDEGVDSDGSNTNEDDVMSLGQGWAQGGEGQEGTCVASSSVTARAMVDPVYALELTGGESGQESDPKAFRGRLIAEQHRIHEYGDGGGNWSGMGLDGEEKVMNKQLNPHTGASYEYHEMKSADARREALPDIEKAVAEGKPVPVGVEGNGAHEMMIIGQEGDKLQIYNPWGTTTWVDEEDFVNGHMNKASNNDLKQVSDVRIPE